MPWTSVRLPRPNAANCSPPCAGNADRGVALLLDRRDTSFAGTAEEIPDEQVITAVKSVPCHY